MQCTKLGAQLFDKFLENGQRTIVGGMLDHDLFLELQLPAKSGPNCKDPTLGLGLTSAITTAASAFLTSAASSNNLVDAALGDQTPHGLMRQHNRHTKRGLRSVSNSRSCHFRPSQVNDDRRSNTKSRHSYIRRKSKR